MQAPVPSRLSGTSQAEGTSLAMTDLFVFEPVGEEVLLRNIERAIAGIERPLPLYKAIGATLEENVNLRFQLKQDPNGRAWAQISDLTPVLYERFHKQPWPGGSLLERSRRMLDSLAANVGDDGIDVGFSVPYAIFHETGTQRGGKPYMPRRGMLMGDPKAGALGDDDRADVQAEIDAYLARLLGG